MSSPVSLVEYQSISKAFGNNVVLTDLSFAVDEGEFSVVFGQSLSGKSVLLRILLGLDHPDAGTVLLRGVDASDTKPGARKIGYVPQSFALTTSHTRSPSSTTPRTPSRRPWSGLPGCSTSLNSSIECRIS